MQGDAKVIEFLNEGLRHELTAVNQYWLHHRLLEHWGYKELSAVWRKESIEEMQHADRLIERILFLEGVPAMHPLEALHIGQTVKDIMERDLEAEMTARALYRQAATHCHAVADYVSRRLFEDLLQDEESHIDFLETQLELIGKLGAELYGQRRLGDLAHD
jgi:bacterioferritin